jgi:hypothetical protein
LLATTFDTINTDTGIFDTPVLHSQFRW